MDARFARFVERLGEMKVKMQRERPGPAHGDERRNAMIDAADGFDADVAFTYPPWLDAPRVELIAVGTELLLGQLTDTNTVFVAQSFAGRASTCMARMRLAIIAVALPRLCAPHSSALTVSLLPAGSVQRSTI